MCNCQLRILISQKPKLGLNYVRWAPRVDVPEENFRYSYTGKWQFYIHVSYC
jgi:hypothetical protein